MIYGDRGKAESNPANPENPAKVVYAVRCIITMAQRSAGTILEYPAGYSWNREERNGVEQDGYRGHRCGNNFVQVGLVSTI